MIHIVVSEDHHIVRRGVCSLLEAENEMTVIGEADNGLDAIRLTRELRPDVLVLDISMPQMDGMDVLKQLRNAALNTRVVILSIHTDLALVQQALELGALGYVLKQSVSEELLDAVRAANRGSGYLSSGVSHLFASHNFAHRPHNPLDRLSPRERKVVKRVVAGQSTKEIADELFVSVKTVEKQRRDAMRKLEVDNVASLVRVSLELGLTLEPFDSDKPDKPQAD